MSTGERIAVPERSRRLLEELIKERERLNGLIEAAVQATRAALDVPDGWALRSLDEGFVAPDAGPEMELGKE